MTSTPKPSSSVERLKQHDRIHASLHRRMVDWLAIQPGARVLDAGCGAGGTTALLAAAVGARGHVIAIDIKPETLAAARETVAAEADAERVSIQEGDVMSMPFANGEFDLVWCSRVVHHLPDQLAAARALARVTRRGGRIVLREGGITSRFLPYDLGIGEPGLEARLQVIQDRWYNRHVRQESSAHRDYPHGWSQLLRDAGCRDVGVQSFLFEAHSPLDPELLEYGLMLLRSRITDQAVAAMLTPEDRHTLEALTDPDGEHSLARRNDLHWLSVASLYIGTPDG